MTNPTSNFGWQMPTNTDLVSQLPADFEVFGQAVDTSLADLKGGTTGQILAKNTNTDMDFVWTSPSPGDITAVTAGTGISGGGTSGDVTITNSMATTITTAGDLIYGTGSGTFTRRAIGTANQVLAVNSGATAPEWVTPTSGGMTVLASGTLSGTGVNITSISQDYKNLQLVVRKFLPTGDNFPLRFRVNNDSGGNYIALNVNNASAQGYGNSSISTGDNDNVLNTGMIVVDYPDYAFTTTKKMGRIQSHMIESSTTFQMVNQPWYYNVEGAITQINILVTSTTIQSGSYVLYGVK